MPEIGTSGSMSGMGNGALPNGPSYRAHPRLYLYSFAPPLPLRGAPGASHATSAVNQPF
jgi:hypothetical protein